LLHPRVLELTTRRSSAMSRRASPSSGSLYRGNQFLEGLVATKVRQGRLGFHQEAPGADPGGRFGNQIEAVLFKASPWGVQRRGREDLAEKLKKPVIVVMRKRPDLEAMRKAVGNLPSPKKRWDLIQHAGEIIALDRLFCQLHGLTPRRPEASPGQHLPRNPSEALRVAHIIASGLARGESRGRA